MWAEVNLNDIHVDLAVAQKQVTRLQARQRGPDNKRSSYQLHQAHIAMRALHRSLSSYELICDAPDEDRVYVQKGFGDADTTPAADD